MKPKYTPCSSTSAGLIKCICKSHMDSSVDMCQSNCYCGQCWMDNCKERAIVAIIFHNQIFQPVLILN